MEMPQFPASSSHTSLVLTGNRMISNDIINNPESLELHHSSTDLLFDAVKVGEQVPILEVLNDQTQWLLESYTAN